MGFDSFSDIQLFQPSFQVFGDNSKCANWYHRQPYVLLKGPSSCLSFCFLWFFSLVRRDGKIYYWTGFRFFFFSFFFFSIISRSSLCTEISWSVCISKSQRILCYWVWFVHVPFDGIDKFQFLAQFPVNYLPPFSHGINYLVIIYTRYSVVYHRLSL